MLSTTWPRLPTVLLAAATSGLLATRASQAVPGDTSGCHRVAKLALFSKGLINGNLKEATPQIKPSRPRTWLLNILLAVRLCNQPVSHNRFNSQHHHQQQRGGFQGFLQKARTLGFLLTQVWLSSCHWESRQITSVALRSLRMEVTLESSPPLALPELPPVQGNRHPPGPRPMRMAPFRGNSLLEPAPHSLPEPSPPSEKNHK